MAAQQKRLYFFDIDDGRELIIDEAGTRMPSVAEVRRQAIALLPNIARDELPDGDKRRFSVRVRNASGVDIFEASLTLAANWLNGAGGA